MLCVRYLPCRCDLTFSRLVLLYFQGFLGEVRRLMFGAEQSSVCLSVLLKPTRLPTAASTDRRIAFHSSAVDKEDCKYAFLAY